MATFEEEYARIEKFVNFIARVFLFPKRIDLRGAENFIRDGPNVIVGNHIGSYQDVSILVRFVPRMIFFTANRMLFNREEASELVLRHLRRHMGKFGGFVHLLLIPFYSYMVHFVSTHAARIGSIPVDLYGKKHESIHKCQDYLRHGRAVIALQGRGRVDPKDPNPYVKPFRRGVAIMAYNLFNKDGFAVPVTPLSLFGTHIMWGVPATVRVNVGRPMFIKDYWAGNEAETVERFRAAMETRVSGLLLESLSW